MKWWFFRQNVRKWIQGVEFHKATVVTTVDTTTAPLSDVYFPSVTICNINQVRGVLRSQYLDRLIGYTYAHLNT